MLIISADKAIKLTETFSVLVLVPVFVLVSCACAYYGNSLFNVIRSQLAVHVVTLRPIDLRLSHVGFHDEMRSFVPASQVEPGRKVSLHGRILTQHLLQDVTV